MTDDSKQALITELHAGLDRLIEACDLDTDLYDIDYILAKARAVFRAIIDYQPNPPESEEE